MFYLKDSIVDLFEKSVNLNKLSTAIIFDGEEISYDKLNKDANMLARRIKGLTVKRIIALKLYRSYKTIQSILAILKAGYAYLPIDADLPISRIKTIISDSGVDTIIMDGPDKNPKINAVLDSMDVNILNPDDNVFIEDDSNLGLDYSINDLMYITYTSGTTGAPKGILVPQKPIVNSVLWSIREFGLDCHDAILQKTELTFDPSVWEIFCALISGARLVLTDEGDQKDPQRIIEKINNHSVSIVHFVPTMLNVFLDYILLSKDEMSKIKSLRIIRSGGEKLTNNIVEKFNELKKIVLNLQLINSYSLAECPIISTAYNVKGTDLNRNVVLIGKPIDNVNVHILRDDLSRCNINEIGEIYLSGAGLSNGYINNSFNVGKIKSVCIDGIYKPAFKTNDLGKMLSDGNIEFCGRNDEQVKIHGIRIEPSEISSVLKKMDTVKDAVVTYFKDSQSQLFLSGYVIIKDGQTYNERDIKEYLGQNLPAYMVPRYIYRLEKFPLLYNGKIDKSNLPNPTVSVRQTYVPPRDKLEKVLVDKMQKTLDLDKIGIDDDFYICGGNSITTIVLVNELKRCGISISVNDILYARTARKIAASINCEDKIIKKGFYLFKKSSNLKRKSVFLIPPSGGYAQIYGNFIRHLRFDGNIYGMNDIRFNYSTPEEILNVSAREVVDGYYKYLKKVFKQDDIIFGYSWGGIVAHNLAVYLQNDNIKSHLVVVDAPPKRLNAGKYDKLDMLYHVTTMLGIKNPQQYAEKELFNLVFDKVLKINKDFDNQRDIMWLLNKAMVMMDANYKMLIDFEANLRSSIYVFMANRKSGEYDQSIWKDEWSQYYKDNISFIDIDGTHLSIMGEDIDNLTNKLNMFLKNIK